MGRRIWVAALATTLLLSMGACGGSSTGSAASSTATSTTTTSTSATPTVTPLGNVTSITNLKDEFMKAGGVCKTYTPLDAQTAPFDASVTIEGANCDGNDTELLTVGDPTNSSVLKETVQESLSGLTKKTWVLQSNNWAILSYKDLTQVKESLGGSLVVKQP